MKHAAKSIFGPLLLLLLMVSHSTVSAQGSTGSVFGVIICNDGNTPGRGARVELMPLNRLLKGEHATSSSGTSDFSGNYEIQSVIPGTYVLSATLDGYDDDSKLVLSALDTFTREQREQLLASFPQITVKAGASVRRDLVLRRAGAVSGHVRVDSGGLPGPANVMAIRVGDLGSEHPLSRIEGSQPFTKSSTPDDRGAFRIGGLPAGRYQLSVRISEAYFRAAVDGSKVRFEPERSGTAELIVFAPEALDVAQARIFEVNDGDEIADAEISVPTRLLHSLAGLATERGLPAAGVTVIVERKGSSMQEIDAMTMQDGSYRFDLLPAGDYVLRAKDPGTSWSGETVVRLQDSDVFDANIDLRGGPDHAH